MARFNTGNALGSDAPEDFSDNAKITDAVVNEDESQTLDRFGNPLKTFHGMGQEFDQKLVDFSQQVNDVLIAGGRIFDNEEQGRAAANNGQYFYAANEDPRVSKTLWKRISSSQSEFIANDPSEEFVSETLEASILAQDLASSPSPVIGEFHSDSDERIPLIADDRGLVLFSVDSEGFPITKIGGEFYSGDEDLDYALINEEGAAILQTKEGRAIAPWRAEFFSADDQPELCLCDEGGAAFLVWDANGNLVVENGAGIKAEQPCLPYREGNLIKAVDSTEITLADAGELNVYSLTPKNAISARAIVEFPWANQPLTCTVGGGMLIPDNARTLFGFVGLGQSLMVGSTSASSLVSVESLYPENVLMFETQGFSDVRIGVPTQGEQPDLQSDSMIGFTPLISKVGLGGGARGETPMEAHGNALQRIASGIGAEFKSLSFTAAQGGTPYSQLKKGTQLYQNLLTATARAVELAEAAGLRFVLAGAVVKHGEADASRVDYYEDLLQWQQDVDGDIKGITGQDIDVHFIYSQPSSFYVNSTPGAAARAMLKAHEESPYHHVAGADYPYQDEYSPDLVHMTGPGYFHIGEKIAEMWAKGVWTKEGKAKVVRMLSASREGRQVDVEFDVPFGPLVFDSSIGLPVPNYGFRYEVLGEFIEIESVEILQGQEGVVRITLANQPGGGEESVHYATEGHSGSRSQETIPRGNLRDSSSEVSAYDARVMYNWACHQIKTVEA